jgi:radical SAM protein with 4Fe4S-binding SPASM domain
MPAVPADRASVPLGSPGEPAGFAVGLALTDNCNLHCAHCYRETLDVGGLSLADVRAICDTIPVRSVNLGTGENGLHPEYHTVLAFLRERGIRHTITTNGYSVEVLDDDELRGFHSVEVSIDFPTEAEQDAFRAPGNWRSCLAVLDRCRRLGVAGGVTAVMMSVNYARLAPIAQLAAEHGATFRVNVYQPVKTDRFSLSYAQFWEGFRRLFAQTQVIACTEPLVNALLGLDGISGPSCGRGTIRVTARRRILPCVYWPARGPALSDLMRDGAALTDSPEWRRLRTVPAACRACPLVATCQGGCASRRLLRGALDEPDEFCPIVRGDTLTLDWARAAGRDLPKAGSACTTIVVPRASGVSPTDAAPRSTPGEGS